MHIRQVTADERLTTTFPLQAYAFDRSPLPVEEFAKFRDYLPYNQRNVSLVAEEDGRTVAAVSAIPMRQNVRGTVYPMAGVAGVATHPLARRRGHVRALLTRLLGDLRDTHPVSVLYPFRPSFYERFGYVGLPRLRTAAFSPADLAPLLRAPLPGEVSWQRIGEGYEAYRDFTVRLLAYRHGFSVFPDERAARLRDSDDRWLVMARVEGAVVGAVTYRIEEHGGDLLADDLLVTGPVGRALLLRFFAGHVDQVARVVLGVPAGELPELWGTDLAVHTEAKVSFPHSPAPMARVLSVDALAGLPVGPGRVAVEVVDDPFVAGRYLLDGTDGGLVVTRGAEPAATLTSAGLSALVYGVLDPDEVVIRGFGQVGPEAAAALRTLFPRALPHVFADF